MARRKKRTAPSAATTPENGPEPTPADAPTNPDPVTLTLLPDAPACVPVRTSAPLIPPPAPDHCHRQRRYSEADVATALATVDECGGSVARAAEKLGIPYGTVMTWVSGTTHPPAASVLADARTRRALAWEELQDAAVARSLEALPEASASAAAVIAGIAHDKAKDIRASIDPTAPASLTVTVTVTASDVEAARNLLASLNQPSS